MCKSKTWVGSRALAVKQGIEMHMWVVNRGRMVKGSVQENKLQARALGAVARRTQDLGVNARGAMQEGGGILVGGDLLP